MLLVINPKSYIRHSAVHGARACERTAIQSHCRPVVSWCYIVGGETHLSCRTSIPTVIKAITYVNVMIVMAFLSYFSDFALFLYYAHLTALEMVLIILMWYIRYELYVGQPPFYTNSVYALIRHIVKVHQSFHVCP